MLCQIGRPLCIPSCFSHLPGEVLRPVLNEAPFENNLDHIIGPQCNCADSKGYKAASYNTAIPWLAEMFLIAIQDAG